MKVVLDTNVIVSAYLFGGRPFEVLMLARQGMIELLTSDEALSELHDVLLRDKLSGRLSELGLTPEDVMSSFSAIAVSVVPTDSPGICEDPDDNLFIGIALPSNSDAIVSGDKHLLGCSGRAAVPILRVSEFLALLRGVAKGNDGETE